MNNDASHPEDHSSQEFDRTRAIGLPSQTLPFPIGNFVLERELGRGGMGIVYQARDTRLNRLVAIKVLGDQAGMDTDALRRFQREARTLAAANHPAIATVYGLEQLNGAEFLVMELVQGQTLKDLLKSGPMSVEAAIEVFSRVADALEAAHEHGIVHRDVKPGMVTRSQLSIPAAIPASIR